MSATDEAPEDSVDTENVGGLGELVPEPLEPVWAYVERFQAFRDTHGETYTKALEAIVAVVLTAGYLYWATLYL
jgi:hypothetical protein